MSAKMISYNGINVKKDLYPIIKHIEDVDKYREELGRLSSSWDIFALLGQLGDINIDIGKTKENFLNLTSTLLNHLSEETIKKVTTEMQFKSQVAIDILIRNLFERTADIGFLSTDDDIRQFIKLYVSDYNEESLVLKKRIQERFKEYVQKYSVYFDIVLTNKKGKILVRLNEDIKVDRINSEFLNKVINSSEDYIESYKFHEFLPQYKKSLVYSYKVTDSNNDKAQELGTLSLCFRFTDEMKGIFSNLIDLKNKEALTILDEEGYVIASSDKQYIPLGVKLPLVLNDAYKIVSFQGRDYIAKTCKTIGYQDFFGLNWYGHIMIPIEYAFLSSEAEFLNVEEKILESMMNNESHFSKDLKEVFNKSKLIQENLTRVIWNGNISQSKINSSNREFSKSLLNEIGITGTKANSSLSNLNNTIISSIVKDSEFLSSLAIDIMDRNLYERANDCRWWALTSYFRGAFSSYENIDEKKEEISEILKYINSLYTVYTNLLVFDKNGKVIAVSNEDEDFLLGKVLTTQYIEETLCLSDTSKYCVSKFEKTNLYKDMPTYIYCSAIRDVKNPQNINGGIAIVFDSKPQFEAMLEESIPNKKGVFAFFTSKDKKIISSTNKNFNVGDLLDIEDSFFELKNAQSKSKIIEYNKKFYSVSSRCSKGYREYKSSSDDYVNDVICLVFICIGESNGPISLNKPTIFKTQSSQNILDEESKELATFFLGKKFLAVDAKNVLESLSIDALEESIDLNQDNPFKGMVLYKQKLVSVLDIREFIQEDVSDEQLSSIILFEYDKDNKEHCVGILVSSLQSISVVKEKSIQEIQSHFLGTGTLINSLVDIKDEEESKVAMILDIKKIDDNLTQKVN